jgi:hypothetical protein
LENHDLQQNVTELYKILQAYDMKISNNKSKDMAMDRTNKNNQGVTRFKIAKQNPNWPNMHMEKATKQVGKKQRSCRLNHTPPTGNTRKPPTRVWYII